MNVKDLKRILKPMDDNLEVYVDNKPLNKIQFGKEEK